MIGGRGYWAHPQVVDLVAYLRALANPRDEEALYTVLASPLVGVSVDALVVVAAAGRAGDRDPWWVIREPEGRFDELRADDLLEADRVCGVVRGRACRRLAQWDRAVHRAGCVPLPAMTWRCSRCRAASGALPTSAS